MNAKIKTPASGYSLITKERTQKLDLLQHLVVNIARAIVVCGPEGVGKSRLLKYFQEMSADSNIFCSINGDSRLSYEQVLDMLKQALVDKMPNLKIPPLSKLSEGLTGQNIKVVLVIDEAGKLAPGLIESLIAYANGQPALRCILVLTHSELYLKNSTDPAIEDCYQIEIPPLSEKQCGEFLEYLSTLPNSRVQFSSINETSVAELYRETHGIPGNILKYLPHPERGKTVDYGKPVLILAVIVLIGVALGVQWWSAKQTTETEQKVVSNLKPNNNQDSRKNKTLVSEQDKQKQFPVQSAAEQTVKKPNQLPIEPLATATPAAPPVQNRILESPKIETPLQKNYVVSASSTTDDATLNPDNLNAQTKPDNAGNIENQTQENTTATQEEGERWIKAEPVENYTLQLMALPDEQTIIDVMTRNQAIGEKLRYVKTKTKTGKDRFILLYGSYPNLEEAGNEASVLPKEFQKTWTRKISVIQQEILTTYSSNSAE
ncbi:MAG: AAA family ATPase [Methylococcaceae bacterium]|nr:AAA family ATPase [Methylococcaceae bacterium]